VTLKGKYDVFSKDLSLAVKGKLDNVIGYSVAAKVNVD
jgi:hypothetical protein